MSLRQATSSSASQSGYQYLCSVPDKCQVSSAQGNYPRETEDDSECCHSWVTWGSCSNLCSISPSDTPLHDTPLPLARPGVSSSSFSLAAVTHWILLFINHPPALPLSLQFLAWQPDTLNPVYSNPNYCDCWSELASITLLIQCVQLTQTILDILGRLPIFCPVCLH